MNIYNLHPTEVISAKISAAALYVPKILLHVSRPVRRDSDEYCQHNEMPGRLDFK